MSRRNPTVAELNARIAKLDKQSGQAYQRWRDLEYEKQRLVRQVEAMEKDKAAR